MQSFDDLKLNAQVIAHGIRWILNGRIPLCPECTSKSLAGPDIATDINIDLYAKAQYECKKCHCVFVIDRDERPDKEDEKES